MIKKILNFFIHLTRDFINIMKFSIWIFLQKIEKTFIANVINKTKFFWPEPKAETYFSFFFLQKKSFLQSLDGSLGDWTLDLWILIFTYIIYLIYTNETRPNQFSHQHTTQKWPTKGVLWMPGKIIRLFYEFSCFFRSL